MSFTVDFDETTDFPNLEPGDYDAVIHSVREEKGDAGTYLATRFSIVSDEMNRQAWLNISLADNSLWRVNGILKRLGLAKGKETYKSRKEFETAVAAMLPGAECRITIANEDFEGSVQDRVTAVNAR